MPEATIYEYCDFLNGERKVWLAHYVIWVYAPSTESMAREHSPDPPLGSSSLAFHSSHGAGTVFRGQIVWQGRIPLGDIVVDHRLF